LVEVPDCVINPFSDTEIVGAMKEELTELQNESELKSKFKKSYEQFWLQKEISALYPSLWGMVKKLLVAFPTSYLLLSCNFFRNKEIDFR
jgi:hypothetical protein